MILRNISLLKGLKKQYGKKALTIYKEMEKEGHKATKKVAINRSKRHHPKWYKTK